MSSENWPGISAVHRILRGKRAVLDFLSLNAPNRLRAIDFINYIVRLLVKLFSNG